MPTIIPNLWFDNQALEAAEYYCSIFPNSQVKEVAHYTEAGPGEPGTVLTAEFLLDGQRYVAINGGPHDEFNDAISLQVECQDQEEIDYYWDRLTADGGVEVQCGWLKDKYGVSWQVVPDELGMLVADADRDRADRAISAMLQMKKIDIALVRTAADGNTKRTGVAGVVKKVTDKLTGKKAPPPAKQAPAPKPAPTSVTPSPPTTPTRVAATKGASTKAPANRTPAKKTAAKKTAAKKTAAKKAAAATKAPTNQAAPTKLTSRKPPAKKPAPPKAPAKAPAKKAR